MTYQTIIIEVRVEDRQMEDGKKIDYISTSALVGSLTRSHSPIVLGGRTFHPYSERYGELSEIKPERNGGWGKDIEEGRMDFTRQILVIRVGERLLTFYRDRQEESKEKES